VNTSGTAATVPQTKLEALAELRSEYARARSSLEEAVTDLRLLVDRRSPDRSGSNERAERTPDAPPSTARLKVTFENIPALLTFQDELVAVPGVESVTVAGAGSNEATLLVFYRSPVGAGVPIVAPTRGPTVVCVQCGAVVVAGGKDISHGLCLNCRDDFIVARTH
jgi:hypothetical protein